MSLIFSILKQHENHDLTCMQKGYDFAVICKDCKRNILVFGEPAVEEAFTHEKEDIDFLYMNDDDEEYDTSDFDDLGDDD